MNVKIWLKKHVYDWIGLGYIAVNSWNVLCFIFLFVYIVYNIVSRVIKFFIWWRNKYKKYAHNKNCIYIWRIKYRKLYNQYWKGHPSIHIWKHLTLDFDSSNLTKMAFYCTHSMCYCATFNVLAFQTCHFLPLRKKIQKRKNVLKNTFIHHYVQG